MRTGHIRGSDPTQLGIATISLTHQWCAHRMVLEFRLARVLQRQVTTFLERLQVVVVAIGPFAAKFILELPKKLFVCT